MNDFQMENRLLWQKLQTKGSSKPSDMTVTHINQAAELFQEAAESLVAHYDESSVWLKTHSIEYLKLTLKDLFNKGVVLRSEMNKETGKIKQQMEFEARDLNKFEYEVNGLINLCMARIKKCMQGSRKIFGMVRGENVGIIVDVSEANFGFGRQLALQNALLHLIDEQLNCKRGLYFASYGSEVHSLWPELRLLNKDLIEEAKNWVMNLTSQGGANLLSALKHIYQIKGIQTLLVMLGSLPDQNLTIVGDYLEQLCVGHDLQIHSVSYDCSDHQTNVVLMKMANMSDGNYHCSNSTIEEAIYASFDVKNLLEEIRRCQDVLEKIKDIRQGKFGSALVTVIHKFSMKGINAPVSHLCLDPPGLGHPLKIEMPSGDLSSSACWIAKNGLKAKGLDLYQVLAPNAFSFREEFIPIIRRRVQSQVHSKSMAQFQWHDGTMKNVHVDVATLYEYQRQLGTMVKLFENRIDWISSSGRSILGTIMEKRVILLLDLSLQNTNYIFDIRNSLRLLLEQQMLNKEYFNVIGCGEDVKMWMPTLVKSTGDHLQQAWKWILNFQCSGSRNTLEGLRRALENDDQEQHHIEVEGIYLFMGGVPDQSPDLLYSYLEEVVVGRNVHLNVVLFNVDDYDSNGAIPSRYANITNTAEILRNMAHCTGGRFQWVQETGIIESDDISALSQEIEKGLNFSKKCAMLVDSVKKKQPVNENGKESLDVEEPSTFSLSFETAVRTLPLPKETALSQARKAFVAEKEKNSWIPKTLTYDRGQIYQPSPMFVQKNGNEFLKRCCRPTKDKRQQSKFYKKVDHAYFYTGNKNDIGSVFTKYQVMEQKLGRNKIPCNFDKEEQITTKNWMKMYSLSKLNLNLDKLAAGSECHHIGHVADRVQILGGKTVDAKLCKIFPTINVSGSLRHLLLSPTDLEEFEEKAVSILVQYLNRLQWLLSGSREIFGAIVERRCIFLIDTSGSMEERMEELKKKLVLLIWEQLHQYTIGFNFIKFSKTCEKWKPSIVESSDDNCQDAVQWVAQLQAGGNTCTLEAFQTAFQEPNLDAIYLLTDGKPDSSFSLTLREVQNLNSKNRVIINTISFNCADSNANEFLQLLSQANRGRYHSVVEKTFDVHLFAHQLIDGKFKDPEFPIMPAFGGDDLKRLAKEITLGRKYIAQSRTYRSSISGSLVTSKQR